METAQKTYIVGAIVPTVYQISSLTTLIGGNKPIGGGRYGWEEEFFSLDQAKEFMHKRNNYMHSEGAIDYVQYQENRNCIEEQWTMYYDGASAWIEEVDQ